MTAAAIKATYSDWRTVKSRKVLQLVFEVALEEQDNVLGMLGAPLPDREVWCGIALLKPATAIAVPAGMELAERGTPRPMHSLPLPQQAALLGDREAFWRYLKERHGSDVRTAGEAAAFIRGYCLVDSRSAIKHGTPAGERFILLQAEFDTWMRNP